MRLFGGWECCLDLGSGLSPGLAPASWFLHNVACNSPARISNFEIGLLKFRGFLDT